jgi:hypothetical protein
MIPVFITELSILFSEFKNAPPPIAPLEQLVWFILRYESLRYVAHAYLAATEFTVLTSLNCACLLMMLHRWRLQIGL